MKRGREDEETHRTERESRARRGSDGSAPPAKRKRWYVATYVQRLLTNYFISPQGVPKPCPAHNDHHHRQREEREGEGGEEGGYEELSDAGATRGGACS